MKKFLIILFCLFSLTLSGFAQDTIALLQPIAVKTSPLPVNTMEINIVRTQLNEGLEKAGYIMLTRVDQQLISKEIAFQQSGVVDDKQITQMGKQFAAQYVCISVITKDKGTLLIEAYLVDIKRGRKFNTVSELITDLKEGDYKPIYTSCAKLVPKMLGKLSGSSSYTPPTRNQNFTETAYGINMKMVWVEGGSFLMGCTSEQGSDCDDDEKNVRRVTLDGFYIGMLEVTQSQWEKVMGTSIYQQMNKSNDDHGTWGVGADYPMYYVNWDEAMDFCRELSRLTGKTYTLPTEAQWEYAAHGGNRSDGTKYAGSNVIDAVAWYFNNSGSSTHRCGTKRANGLGIYDMSGNVYEWCKDWYSSSYTSYDTNNPTGPSSGSYRVYRGGGWVSLAWICRVADRYYGSPGNRGDYLGFRVVCIP